MCTSDHVSGQVNPSIEPTTGSPSADATRSGTSIERNHTEGPQSHQCLRGGSTERGQLETRTPARPDPCRVVGGNTSQSCQERREGSGGMAYEHLRVGFDLDPLLKALSTFCNHVLADTTDAATTWKIRQSSVAPLIKPGSSGIRPASVGSTGACRAHGALAGALHCSAKRSATTTVCSRTKFGD